MSKIKKVLICGATGFMGRNIAEYFKDIDGFEAYATGLNRTLGHWPQDRFFKVDLTSRLEVEELFSKHKFDIVIQAAATTSGSKDILERPYLHVTDNAVMNSLILQACYDYDVGHFLFLSCGVMYNPERSPVTEKDFYLDEGIFHRYFGVGWTKVYVEKMCEFFSGLGRTKHTVIRHSNTYGPYDKYDLEKSHMFGATVTKVMSAADDGEIVVWGDGLGTERDLLYVDDVVLFIHKAIEKQEEDYKLYNVGYGKCFTVKQIVEKIINASGKNLSIAYDLTKPSIKTKLALISTKAYEELGWKPEITLDAGIAKTIQWYENNKKA
jgi:GDP-L-fucose synthase|tara:strand:- start:11692 stop:12663 length:972 start_codon:yes stop_codon:yes gene_type:complete